MISVEFGDILKADVDAIVNPANTQMLHGGGLASVIARRAGIEVVNASRAQAPIETGEAIITEAGKLPFKRIIHAVGPVWEAEDDFPYWRKNSSDADPDWLMRMAYFNSMRLAGENDLTSVAFPAISCGVFHFPVDRAAPIAIQAVRDAQRAFYKVERVVFCLLDENHFAAFFDANEAE